MHLVINCSGNEMKITLWGARAREFEAEQVYAAGETGAVIGIFVGVLPKMLQGCFTLVPCSISETLLTLFSVSICSLIPSLYILFFLGVKSLSGSSACRWYIDEDLPDINSLRARCLFFSINYTWLSYLLLCFTNLLLFCFVALEKRLLQLLFMHLLIKVWMQLVFVRLQLS